jgi:type II secretory pathway pseudopilin PulG
MKESATAGVTLVELMVAMAIALVVGAMVMQMLISYQSRILVEVSRNDLQDRAERLMRFLAKDIREAAFLLGSNPALADGTPVMLIHDSLAGDPLQTLPSSILTQDHDDQDDLLTIVKAASFSPPIYLAQSSFAGDDSLLLSRRPNRSPGSSRELSPAPEAISHLVLANHRVPYSVRSADLVVELNQQLLEDVPIETELLGVRASSYLLDPFAGSKRLRRDDFTSRDILDDAVDGLQFEYLLNDGSLVHQPDRPQDVRGVRVNLLVKDLRSDRDYLDEKIYTLGNCQYGPYQDHHRRIQLSRLVEVKNHGL